MATSEQLQKQSSALLLLEDTQENEVALPNIVIESDQRVVTMEAKNASIPLSPTLLSVELAHDCAVEEKQMAELATEPDDDEEYIYVSPLMIEMRKQVSQEFLAALRDRQQVKLLQEEWSRALQE